MGLDNGETSYSKALVEQAPREPTSCPRSNFQFPSWNHDDRVLPIYKKQSESPTTSSAHGASAFLILPRSFMVVLGRKQKQLLLLTAVSASSSYCPAFTMNVAPQKPAALPPTTPRIAIVGAGAAGLAAARSFQSHNCQPVIFEASPELGGVWRYQPQTKPKQHPMYKNLRTNLPKELMAFREFPFSSSSTSFSSTETSFVSHAHVLQYLQDYAATFQLDQYMRFNTRIDQLTVVHGESQPSSSLLCPDWPKLQLQYTNTITSNHATHTDVFDAVCICNGHYSRPYLPHHMPDLDQFVGDVLHSISYDDPNDPLFRNKRVLCVGARASGSDIARELVGHASHVFLSDSTYAKNDPWTKHGVTLLPRLLRIVGPRTVELGCNPDPGAEEPPIVVDDVDVLLFCTGYSYDFPFVNAQSNLELDVGQGRVRPLLEQLWHATVPNVAFLGLPHSIVPFPLLELQAQACRRQWLDLQGQEWPENRLAAAERDAVVGGPSGTGRVKDTHYLGDAQWNYCRTMAQYAGVLDDAMEAYLQTNQVRGSLVIGFRINNDNEMICAIASAFFRLSLEGWREHARHGARGSRLHNPAPP